MACLEQLALLVAGGCTEELTLDAMMLLIKLVAKHRLPVLQKLLDVGEIAIFLVFIFFGLRNRTIGRFSRRIGATDSGFVLDHQVLGDDVLLDLVYFDGLVRVNGIGLELRRLAKVRVRAMILQLKHICRAFAIHAELSIWRLDDAH